MCRKRMSKSKRGFTLIELLVVISVITLLMALLFPALQVAKKQANAVVCQSNLRQWGVAFFLYLSEHDGKLPSQHGKNHHWFLFMRDYYAEDKNLLLCPMARRYEIDKEDPRWQEKMATGYIAGGKFTAWRVSGDFGAPTGYVTVRSSYGMNMDAQSAYSVHVPELFRNRRDPMEAHMPLLLDAGHGASLARPHYEPPPYDGALLYESPMRWWCLDRHNSGINSLFMDSSVRKVGLKELWTLKWYPGYNTQGPWTRAGGVSPTDWPLWMRKFRDY